MNTYIFVTNQLFFQTNHNVFHIYIICQWFCNLHVVLERIFIKLGTSVSKFWLFFNCADTGFVLFCFQNGWCTYVFFFLYVFSNTKYNKGNISKYLFSKHYLSSTNFFQEYLFSDSVKILHFSQLYRLNECFFFKS